MADLRIGQMVCWGLCRESFFSGPVGFVELYWVSMKGFHIRGMAVESIRVAYIDWCNKQTCHVYQVSLPC
jgi:hypothetical protein